MIVFHYLCIIVVVGYHSYVLPVVLYCTVGPLLQYLYVLQNEFEYGISVSRTPGTKRPVVISIDTV